ncbi:MAG TPA: tellurite resistance/C4-dicarboxylate transporter family protein [Streptosporangiaceae bacterium]
MTAGWQNGLRDAVRDLDPGYFALVMATGIVSQAVRLDGAAGLSGILLGVTIAAYLLLAAAYGWRLVSYRARLRADAADPRRAFSLFTFVAGTDVLAARLAADRHLAAAAVLAAVGAASWLALSYGLPLLLARQRRPRAVLASANGSWFLWVVAAASVAVAATSVAAPVPAALAAAAVACWAVAVLLYLLTAVLVTGALLVYGLRPAELTPAYWVFMGATAISVLAGAQILRLAPGPLAAAVHGVVAGLSVVLWAFGTWLIPFLLAAGIWRHGRHRVPLGYEPGLWSLAFPVGMYGVASHELGQAIGVSWLVTLGRDEAWLALAVWAAVAAAMGWAAARRLASRVPARTHAAR